MDVVNDGILAADVNIAFEVFPHISSYARAKCSLVCRNWYAAAVEVSRSMAARRHRWLYDYGREHINIATLDARVLGDYHLSAMLGLGNIPISPSLLVTACASGCTNVVSAIFATNPVLTTHTLHKMMYRGMVNKHKRICQLIESLMKQIIALKRKEILETIDNPLQAFTTALEFEKSTTDQMQCAAAMAVATIGDLFVIAATWDNLNEHARELTLELACKYNHEDIINFAIDKGGVLTTRHIMSCMYRGNEDFIIRMIERGGGFKPEMVSAVLMFDLPSILGRYVFGQRAGDAAMALIWCAVIKYTHNLLLSRRMYEYIARQWSSENVDFHRFDNLVFKTKLDHILPKYNCDWDANTTLDEYISYVLPDRIHCKMAAHVRAIGVEHKYAGYELVDVLLARDSTIIDIDDLTARLCFLGYNKAVRKLTARTLRRCGRCKEDGTEHLAIAAAIPLNAAH